VAHIDLILNMLTEKFTIWPQAISQSKVCKDGFLLAFSSFL
jgi:hypothetical protein